MKIRAKSRSTGKTPVAVGAVLCVVFAALTALAQPQNTAGQGTASTPANHAHAAKFTSVPISPSTFIQLGHNWSTIPRRDAPPPEGLGPYAPPFHFSHVLLYGNSKKHALLQLANSDNPLLGHDAYWLDQQLHSQPGSGMSLQDFLFFLFLPPARECMTSAYSNYTDATRLPPSDEVSSTDLKVFYDCNFPATLYGFFAEELSAGLSVEQGTNGARAYGKYSDFYLPPMQQDDFNGITFYVFEATRTEGISSDAATYFHLPGDLAGAQADYLWAIGAPEPFPFAQDSSRADPSLIHIAYAGIGGDARSDFLALLQRIHLTQSPTPSAQ